MATRFLHEARLHFSFSFRSDEGLTLETSAFLLFHSGNLTLINSLDQTKILFHSPNDTIGQFL